MDALYRNKRREARSDGCHTAKGNGQTSTGRHVNGPMQGCRYAVRSTCGVSNGVSTERRYRSRTDTLCLCRRQALPWPNALIASVRVVALDQVTQGTPSV